MKKAQKSHQNAAQRIQRLEEENNELKEQMGEQKGVVDRVKKQASKKREEIRMCRLI